MSKHYWSVNETELVREFHQCYTANTSASTRQRIFTKLMPQFNYMLECAQQSIMSSWSREDKEEAKQDVLLKLWEILSNKIDLSKIDGVLNLLWVSAKNMLYTVVRQHHNKRIDLVYTENSENLHYENRYYKHYFNNYDYDDYIDYHSVRAGTEIQTDDVDYDKIKAEIYAEIDRKIYDEHIINKRNTLYLILLKEFLIENDCNGNGFREYICKKLNINRHNFYQINHKLGIRSFEFNNKKEKKNGEDNYTKGKG